MGGLRDGGRLAHVRAVMSARADRMVVRGDHDQPVSTLRRVLFAATAVAVVVTLTTGGLAAADPVAPIAPIAPAAAVAPVLPTCLPGQEATSQAGSGTPAPLGNLQGLPDDVEGRRQFRRHRAGRRPGRDGGHRDRGRQADGHHPSRHRDRHLGRHRAVEPAPGGGQQGLAGAVPAEPGHLHPVPAHRTRWRVLDVLRPAGQAGPGIRHRSAAELRDRRCRPEDDDRRAFRRVPGHGNRLWPTSCSTRSRCSRTT